MEDKIYQDYCKRINNIYTRMMGAINAKKAEPTRHQLALEITRYWAEELWVRLLKAENETLRAEIVASDSRWNDRELVWNAYEAKRYGGIENQPLEILLRLFEYPVPELNDILKLPVTERTIPLGNYSLTDNDQLAMKASR